MRTLLLAILLPGLLSLKAQWDPIATGVGGTIESIDFVGNTGLFCQTGAMRRSTDGGNTWTAVGTAAGYRDVDMADASTAYAAGVVGTSMYMSTTGGQTWVQITPPTSNSLWGVSAPSPGRAFFSGTGNVVWRTDNFASTVAVVNVPSSPSITVTDIQFLSDDVGCAVGETSRIYRTTNGGASWTQTYAGTGSLLRAIHFPSPQRGYAVGSAGRVIRTTDGGVTWQELNTGSTIYLRSVHFYDDLHGCAVGFTGTVLYTNDGGDTWNTLAPPTAENLHAVYMFGPAHALVAGEGGVMFRNNAISVGLDELVRKNEPLPVWPNPASTELVVQLPDGEVELRDLQLLDAAGRTVVVPYTLRQGTGQVRLDVAGLADGRYVLRVLLGDGIRTMPVQVQR